MEKSEIEKHLQDVLLPVFGLTSVDEIPAEASLVNDIGADSLDFVEITYVIEKEFGIALKPGELVSGGAKIAAEELFAEGRLTASGAEALKNHFSDSGSRFAEGMTKIELFRSLSIRDLAEIIWKHTSELHRKGTEGSQCMQNRVQPC